MHAYFHTCHTCGNFHTCHVCGDTPIRDTPILCALNTSDQATPDTDLCVSRHHIRDTHAVISIRVTFEISPVIGSPSGDGGLQMFGSLISEG